MYILFSLRVTSVSNMTVICGALVNQNGGLDQSVSENGSTLLSLRVGPK